VHACTASRSGNDAVAAVLRGGDVDAFVHMLLARVSWIGGQGGHAAHFRLVKRAARGPQRRAVGTGIQVAQQEARRSADGSVDKMPHRTSGDEMAPGCRRTSGGTVARRN
jgi:hypothetical protein